MNPFFPLKGKSLPQLSGKMQRTALGLATSFALLSTLSVSQAAWAELFPLQSIDFVSQPGTTKIYLHTGSIVPYRTVLISDNKIVIDIDQVNAQEAIQTHFSHADNISHVVLQPLSSSTVRVIVRGENLSAPSLSFKDLRSQSQGPVQPQEVESDSDIITTSKPAVSQTIAQDATMPKVVDPLAEGGNGSSPAQDAISSDASDIAFNHDAAASETPPTPDTPIDLKESLIDTPEEGNNDLPFGGENLINGLLYGLGGLLILGAGGFVAYRIKTMQGKNDLGFETTAHAPKQNKQQFRDLAEQYQLGQGHTPKQHAGKPSPIGLTSFQQDELPPHLSAQLEEQFMYGPPQRPSTPAPQKQALNQYAKQTGAAPANPANKKRMTDEALRQEINRSSEIRKQTTENLLDSNRQRSSQAASVVRKTAAASMPKKAQGGLGNNVNQSLPPNPEVLNFLRNVADLMEKDGKTPSAINKSIAQQRKTH